MRPGTSATLDPDPPPAATCVWCGGPLPAYKTRHLPLCRVCKARHSLHITADWRKGRAVAAHGAAEAARSDGKTAHGEAKAA
jgi:hypothetical protein